MKQLVIPISDNVARVYKGYKPEEQQKANLFVNAILNDFIKIKNERLFWNSAKKLSKQAQANGLTEEELLNLLNEG
jgi:hypothetical protein